MISDADRGTAPCERLRLPDQIDIQHGPAKVLAPFILLADRMARDHGVYLSISTDFGDLLSVNEANRDTWDELLPTINPVHNELGPANAFWLRGADRTGRVVLTRACRLFDWQRTNMHEELTSLRMFYSSPNNCTPDETCYCTAELARSVRGLVAYSSGAWHHPSVRGRRMAGISGRLVKAIAFAKWGPDLWAGMMDDEVYRGGLIGEYGEQATDFGVEYRQYGGGNTYRMWVLSMTRAQMIADLKAFLTQGRQSPSPTSPAAN